MMMVVVNMPRMSKQDIFVLPSSYVGAKTRSVHLQKNLRSFRLRATQEEALESG